MEDFSYLWSKPADSGGEDFSHLWGGTLAPTVVKQGQNTGFGGDTATDVKRGLQGIPGMVAGLADIPVAAATGARPFTRAADWAGEATGFRPGQWAETARQEYSPQRRASDTAVDTAWDDPSLSYWEKAASLAQNPRHTAGAVFESLPSMVGGGVGGMAVKGLLARRGLAMSGAAAGGTGESAVMAGQQMTQYDPNLENQRRAAFGSAVTGAAGGLIGMGMGRVAGRMGLDDIDTLVAGGGSADLLLGATNNVRARLGRGLATGGMEATEEALQSIPETAMQNWETDRPWSEGMARAMTEGAAAGGVMGGALGLRGRRLPPGPTEQIIYPDEPADLLKPTETISYPERGPLPPIPGAQPTLGVWSGKSPKKIAAEAARAANAQEKAVKTEAAKTGKGIPVMTPTTLMQARLDKHLAAGEITDVQHQDLTSAMESYGGKNRGRMLAKMNKEINDALQVGSTAQMAAREQAQGSQSLGVGQVVGGAQAPGPGEVQAASQTQVAIPEAKIAAFIESLPESEKAVFSLVKAAAENHSLDQYISPEGKWQATKMGEELGMIRQTAHVAVRRLRGKLNSVAGGDIKAALAATTMAKRTTEGSDYDNLGLSPALQNAGTVDETAMLGGEGIDQSMGIISSAGGSQSDVGENVQPHDYVDTVIPTAKSMEAARENKMRALVAAAQDGTLNEAVNTWNEIAPTLTGIPDISARLDANEENLDFLADWVNAYADVRAEADEKRSFSKFIDEVGEYEREAKRVAEKHGLRAGPMVENEPGSQAGVLEAVPEVDTGTAENGAVAKKPVEVTVKKKRTIVKPAEDKLAAGERPSWFLGSNKEKVNDVISKAFFSPARMSQLVTIYANAEEAIAAPTINGAAKKALMAGDLVGGWVSPDGHVYLVAENIYDDERTILGVFLHEVGVHLGMEKLIGKANMAALADKVEEWAQLKDGSQEALRAEEAVHRAKKDIDSPHYREELVAYMVQALVEAGVNPQALGQSDAHKWFRKLWAAAKAALRHLGLRVDEFTPQNLVDLAYGAAELELTGAWHGTAGEFRKFSHDYMGAGEGAQAYGWGTYLAQRPGVAKGYWEADVQRKQWAPSSLTGIMMDPKRAADVEKFAAFMNINISKLAGYINKAPDALLNTPSIGKVFGVVAGHKYNASDYSLVLRQVFNNLYWGSRNPTKSTITNADISDAISEEIDLAIAGAEEAHKNRDKKGSLMRVASNVRDDEFLDWDKPLSEQSEKVKEALKRVIDETGISNPEEATGGGLYQYLENEPDRFKDAEELSKYLDSIGIKGIKFLDAQSRGKTEGQTSNFVIFNDKNLVRVKTQVGASKDDEAIKFSISAPVPPSQATARSEGQLKEILQALATPNVRGNAASKAAVVMPFTRDLASWAGKFMPSASKWWDALNARMAKSREWSLRSHNVTQAFLDLPEKAQESVQRFLFDGKMAGAWGYKPEWDKEVTTSPEMEVKWRALSTAEQKVADDTLHLFRDSRQAHIAAVEQNIKNARRYAESLQDEGTKESIKKEFDEQMTSMRMWASYKGPYIPTMRFGDHFVEAKSQDYLNAIAAAGDDAKVRELKSDAKHYHYAQFDTQAGAERARSELSKKFAEVVAQPKVDSEKGKRADFSALLRLETILKDRADNKGVGEVREAIHALWRNLADEYAEIQSHQQFKAIAGAKWEETMRGVALRGQQMAFTIGALEHNREITNALYDMQKEIKTSSDAVTATNIYNEVNARYYNSLDGGDVNEAVRKVMSGVSVWKLLTNPTYYLLQLIQPYQYSIPHMTKYFSYGESVKEMLSTAGVIATVFKQSKGVLRVAEDLSWVKDGKERAMLTWLQSKNLLDMGVETEMGSLEGANKLAQNIDRIALRPLRNAVQNTELVNRISTALAVYRLAQKRNWSESKARDAVEDTINTTHGNYAGFNAPRFLNTKGWARIPVQFRKFQLIQATYLYRNIINEVARLKTPGERAAAMKTIAATLGHTMAVAGLKGTAFVGWIGLVAMALGAGGDDDDPRSTDLKAHEWLVSNFGKEVADMVMYGLPTALGVNISARTAVNPLSIMPFDNQSLVDVFSSKKKLQEGSFTLLGGAAGGVLADTVDGYDLMQKGQYYKGAAMLLPTLPRNMMKSYKQATEGLSQRDGDIALSAEEFSMWDSMMQVMGASPMKAQEMYWKQQQLTAMTDEFKSQVSELKGMYVDGDKAEARKEWMKMRLAMRSVGLTPPPLSDLIKAPHEKRKREREMKRSGGVGNVAKQNRRAVAMMQ